MARLWLPRSIARAVGERTSSMRTLSLGRPDAIPVIVEAQLADGRYLVRRDSWPCSIKVRVIPAGGQIPTPRRMDMYFEDGRRDRPFLFWPEGRLRSLGPLVSTGQLGDWTTFMQNPWRSGHGEAAAALPTLADNTTTTYLSGGNVGFYILRISGGYVYATKRTGAGGEEADTVYRMAVSSPTPTHSSVRPGPVMDMAFDPFTHDLFVVEVEDSANINHYAPMEKPDATTLPSYAGFPGAWVGQVAPSRYRVARLAKDTLAEVWVSNWIAGEGCMDGCSYQPQGQYGAGTPIRAGGRISRVGGNGITFFGNRVVILGRRFVSGVCVPCTWTYEIGESASPDPVATAQLGYSTPPFVQIGTRMAQPTPPVGYGGKVQRPDGRQASGWFGSGNGLSVDTGDPLTTYYAPAWKAAETSGQYEICPSRHWISFPNQGVHVPAPAYQVTETQSQTFPTGGTNHLLLRWRGISQMRGFAAEGTTVWSRDGWSGNSTAGVIERYIPLVGSRDGILVVHTTREEYQRYSWDGGMLFGPSSRYTHEGVGIFKSEIFLDTYRAFTGERLTRNKFEGQQTFSSDVRIPTGNVENGPPYYPHQLSKPYPAGSWRGGGTDNGTLSTLPYLYPDGNFYSSQGPTGSAMSRQLTFSRTCVFDAPYLEHHSVCCALTEDQSQLIFAPVWYPSSAFTGGEPRIMWMDGLELQNDGLGADYRTSERMWLVSRGLDGRLLWRNEITFASPPTLVTVSNPVPFGGNKVAINYRVDGVGKVRLVSTSATSGSAPGVTLAENSYTAMASSRLKSVMGPTAISPNEHLTDELLIAGHDSLFTTVGDALVRLTT